MRKIGEGFLTPNKSIKKNVVSVLVLVVVTIALGVLIRQHAYSGVPDLRSTITSGNDYYMSVVSNSKTIENREEFAKQIIQMCIDNSFKSVILSNDENGYPRRMKVSVYHTAEEIGKDDAVFQFSYEPKELNVEYDIRSNPEKYELKIF